MLQFGMVTYKTNDLVSQAKKLYDEKVKDISKKPAALVRVYKKEDPFIGCYAVVTNFQQDDYLQLYKKQNYEFKKLDTTKKQINALKGINDTEKDTQISEAEKNYHSTMVNFFRVRRIAPFVNNNVDALDTFETVESWQSNSKYGPITEVKDEDKK